MRSKSGRWLAILDAVDEPLFEFLTNIVDGSSIALGAGRIGLIKSMFGKLCDPAPDDSRFVIEEAVGCVCGRCGADGCDWEMLEKFVLADVLHPTTREWDALTPLKQQDKIQELLDTLL